MPLLGKGLLPIFFELAYFGTMHAFVALAPLCTCTLLRMPLRAWRSCPATPIQRSLLAHTLSARGMLGSTLGAHGVLAAMFQLNLLPALYNSSLLHPVVVLLDT